MLCTPYPCPTTLYPYIHRTVLTSESSVVASLSLILTCNYNTFLGPPPPWESHFPINQSPSFYCGSGHSLLLIRRLLHLDLAPDPSPVVILFHTLYYALWGPQATFTLSHSRFSHSTAVPRRSNISCSSACNLKIAVRCGTARHGLFRR